MNYTERVDRIFSSIRDPIAIEMELETLLPAMIPIRQDAFTELGATWLKFSRNRPEDAQFLWEEGSAHSRFIAATSAPYSPIIDNLRTYYHSYLLEEYADLEVPEDEPHLTIDRKLSRLYLSTTSEPSMEATLSNLTHLLYPKRLVLAKPAPLPPWILGAAYVVFAVPPTTANELVLHHASSETLSADAGYKDSLGTFSTISRIPLHHPSAKEYSAGTAILSPAPANIFEGEHFCYTLCLGNGVF